MNSVSSRSFSAKSAFLSRIAAEDNRRQAERDEQDRQIVQREGEAIKERCKTLRGFAREAWHVLEPTTPYKSGWATDAIDEHLEAVSRGQFNRLLINVPPGMRKSLGACVLWPAWEWGPFGSPGLRYLTASWNEDYAIRDSRKTRDLIESQWYQGLWGSTVQLTRRGEDDFENSAHGGRVAKNMLGLTSGRGDRVIIDDPHSTETAESDTERKRTVRVFRESVTTRVNDPATSAMIVIMQRLHEQDVSGTILAEKFGYVHLMLPMEFEAKRRCVTPIFRDPRTKENELLFPERFPREAVDRDKKLLGEYAVAGQLQQRPAPREGGEFKRGWFEVVDAVPAGGIECRAWDLGASTDGDWSVGVKMRKVGGVYYIIHIERFRYTPGPRDQMIKNTATSDGKRCRIRLPQDPGQAGKSQKMTLATLIDGYDFLILPVTGEKPVRARGLRAQAEVGNVKLLRGDWNEPFLEEISMFPGGSYDDQVDAAADAYNDLVAMSGTGAVLTGATVVTRAKGDMGS